MIKRLGIIGLIIFIGCILCVLVGVLGGARLVETLLNNGKALGDSASAFMMSLRDENLDNAYAMLTPELQELENRSNFKEMFTGNSIKDWNFNNFSIKNDLGYVAGTVMDDEGDHFVALQMVNRNDTWSITGYNMGALGWVGTVIDLHD